MQAGKPWWQLTKTVRQGFVMSGLSAGAGLLMLVAGFTEPSLVWIPGVYCLLLSALYLASAVAIRRRERARARGQPGLPPSS